MNIKSHGLAFDDIFDPLDKETPWGIRHVKTLWKGLLFRLAIGKILIIIAHTKSLDIGIEATTKHFQINAGFLYINIRW